MSERGPAVGRRGSTWPLSASCARGQRRAGRTRLRDERKRGEDGNASEGCALERDRLEREMRPEQSCGSRARCWERVGAQQPNEQTADRRPHHGDLESRLDLISPRRPLSSQVLNTVGLSRSQANPHRRSYWYCKRFRKLDSRRRGGLLGGIGQARPRRPVPSETGQHGTASTARKRK